MESNVQSVYSVLVMIAPLVVSIIVFFFERRHPRGGAAKESKVQSVYSVLVMIALLVVPIIVFVCFGYLHSRGGAAMESNVQSVYSVLVMIALLVVPIIVFVCFEYLHSRGGAAMESNVQSVYSVLVMIALLVVPIIVYVCFGYLHSREAGRQHKNVLEMESRRIRGSITGGEQQARRCFLDEMYTGLIITLVSEQGVIENALNSTWREFKHTSQEDNSCVFELSGSKPIKIDTDGTTVVIGTAGVGKSTMMQKITRDWAKGNQYQQFNFVFYFNFPQLSLIKVRTNLATLILDFYPYFENKLEILWQDPSRILFIFDDLDKYKHKIDCRNVQSNKENVNPCFSPESCGLVSDIVRWLLQGELLKGCAVLIATRPWGLKYLEKANTKMILQIMGYTFDKAIVYFRRYFRDEKFVLALTECLKQNETLNNMCYNPLFCFTLSSSVESYSKEFGEKPFFTPTSTQELSTYVASLLERLGYDMERCRNEIMPLGQLACQRIGKNLIRFQADQVENISHKLSNFNSVFMMEVHDMDSKSFYTFTDVIMQNFIGALMKHRTSNTIELRGLLDEIYRGTDDRLNIFLRFLFGLSAQNSIKELELQLGKIPHDVSDILSQWLAENIMKRGVTLDNGQAQNKFLKLLHYLYEFGDTELMTSALASIKKIDFRKCSLKLSDCAVLSVTLSNAKMLEELNFDTGNVQDGGIKLLDPILQKCKP
ncbi:NACHT, LRR and PYD domains-containing protein 3-like [Scyliorhinus canicula]|uniref:NACHT, LRR and PYD domains-containing protein 3-like n=1 Tax=Scyliorhinus canicula TaxID=7830 RepID=UPI0018F46D7D|nr:NACHT, LRR and PYD domains-containing protein 3-like [Scyliorhinus canicula]